MTEETAQIDWISLEDKRAAARLMLEQSAERIGIEQLAHFLRLEPSTLRNQLARRERKQPSSDLADLCRLLDPIYRRQLAGQTGEVLTRPADLTPEEAVRELVTEALAGEFGNTGKAKVLAVLARMKGGAR